MDKRRVILSKKSCTHNNYKICVDFDFTENPTIMKSINPNYPIIEKLGIIIF